jgi:hypothetical protein
VAISKETSRRIEHVVPLKVANAMRDPMLREELDTDPVFAMTELTANRFRVQE